jgi:hypothetical protein
MAATASHPPCATWWRLPFTAEPWRRTGYVLLAIPIALPALAITSYGWAIAALNLAYPLRWLIGMGGSYEDAWGGPTFTGVWAFHAVFGGLSFLFLMPWILRGLNRLQIRLLG